MATSPSLSQVLDKVSMMYQMDRQLTTSAIAQMHQDFPRPTNPPPNHGIPDLEQRKELFRQYAGFCSKYNFAQPNTVALCLFLVIPVDRLQSAMDAANNFVDLYGKAAQELFNETAYTGLRVFLAKSSLDKAEGDSSDASPRNAHDLSLSSASARVTAMVSSPLARPPMRASLSEEPANKPSKKRKAPASGFDGPSSRTRLRTRQAQSPAPAAPAPAAPATPPRRLPRPAPPHITGSSSSSTSGPASPRRSPSSVLPAFVPGSPFAPPSPTPSFIHRSRSAVAAARTRDHNQCILTGHPLVQAAHVYPFSATKLAYHAAAGTSIGATKKHAAIGSLLSMWNGNMNHAWRDACNDKAVSETAQNLLCMDHYLHALWGHASFGLEPLTTRLAGDGGELDVRFHWLRHGTRRPRDGVDVDDLDAAVAAVVCGRLDDPPLEPLAHRKSGVPLQTGHIFTIRADSVDQLPSFALLEVQWHLTRLAAMCGAADVDDDDDDDTSALHVQRNNYEEWLADIEPLDLNDAVLDGSADEHDIL